MEEATKQIDKALFHAGEEVESAQDRSTPARPAPPAPPPAPSAEREGRLRSLISR